MGCKVLKVLFVSVLLFFLSFDLSGVGIVPKPVYSQVKEGVIVVNSETGIYVENELEESALFIQKLISKTTGLPVERIYQLQDNAIILNLDNQREDLGDEGYEIDICSDNIVFTVYNESALFYATQSFLQLLPAEVYSSESFKSEYEVTQLFIRDYPRFAWRGMMLDVSRQFFDVDFIKKYIDWLSAHKINIFHWHLTDDEGWRIEIEKYPLLTEKGAWRGENEVLPPAYGSGDERYGGYYTQQEIREIVEYAKKRNVSILPEIDMPGHSRAVTVTYPEVLCLSNDTSTSVQGIPQNVWCAGREENFNMITDILQETADLFPFEYIHIGGDEVNMQIWESCERCAKLMEQEGFDDVKELQSWFVRRVEAIVEGMDKKMIGWNEIMDGGDLGENTAVIAWQGSDYGVRGVKEGYDVIMAPAQYLYFDMAQSPDEQGHSWAGKVPLERVYQFDPHMPEEELTRFEIDNIMGVQAALWSEYLDSPDGIAEYQTYPRLSALAELAWTPQDMRDWDEFYERLTFNHLERLYNMGISFRLPPPDVIYSDGYIKAVQPFGEKVIRYDESGNTPTFESPVLNKPIKTDRADSFRFRTFYRSQGSITMPAFPYPVAEWNPETTPLNYEEVVYDISDFIDMAGDYNVMFRLRSGRNGLLVRKVSLYVNGDLVDEDIHDGVMAAGRTSNNIYSLALENFSKGDKIKLGIEMQGRWGVDTFGDILLYNSAKWQLNSDD
ncbi:family 20 glycosylhydrolase [Marinilabiliaceae bacterium ANBcel2]|nr:family 20 glycosylhydrolase [Marinilabiliaceae bacterium ANBcel2]